MSAYLLDTNILRELYMPSHHEKFKHWFVRQEHENLYITTFSIAEIRYGIEKLPLSRKRHDIEAWLVERLIPNFNNRILTFDLKSAQAWGVMTAQNAKMGRPKPPMDSLLAAIALAHAVVLVTRNIKDFSGLGVELINPFGDQK